MSFLKLKNIMYGVYGNEYGHRRHSSVCFTSQGFFIFSQVLFSVYHVQSVDTCVDV